MNYLQTIDANLVNSMIGTRVIEIRQVQANKNKFNKVMKMIVDIRNSWYKYYHNFEFDTCWYQLTSVKYSHPSYLQKYQID